MRWPLKYQILVRVVLLVLATIAAVTYANIRSTIADSRIREQNRATDIAELLSSTRFPLTAGVLQSMSSLSGAEFLVTDDAGNELARTLGAPQLGRGEDHNPRGVSQSGKAISVELDDRSFFYSVISKLDLTRSIPAELQVHVFVPRLPDREIWWQASRSPLWIAAIVLPIALIISLGLAAQVTRPLARLKTQVHEIAEGNIHEIPPEPRNDEVRDLNVTINEMAHQLRDHDRQVRQNERLSTLVQLGSGFAHHLRNSATGCKMAIELLASEQPDIGASDNINVARRQLGVMENYIQKFMSLAEPGRDAGEFESTQVDLRKTMDQVIYLLSPSASHLNVKLVTHQKGDYARLTMRKDDAEQLMTNLISNAIAAASENAVTQHGAAVVTVELDASDEGHPTFSVTDSGNGPPPEIADKIFQPFISGKQEGTGLGLSLVQEIADRVGGRIQWSRDNGKTRFTFEFTTS